MKNNPTTLRARQLRRAGNLAECALWNVLRRKQLGGYKFVRQQPIGPYYADFASRSCKLAIELDGSQHFENDHDRQRDAYFQSVGYSVLRFPAVSVLQDVRVVCDTILAALEGRLQAVIIAPDLRYVSASVA